MNSGRVAAAAAGLLLVVGCARVDRTDLADPADYLLPDAPPVTDHPADPELGTRWSELVSSLRDGAIGRQAIEALVASGDVRLTWLLADLLRFTSPGDDADAIADAFGSLTGVDPSVDPTFATSPWRSVTNHLFAWDLPAPAAYRELKRELFLVVEPGWEPFFADETSRIDWRFVSWGGVGIDDRPLGDPNPCAGGCIPALDDPELTDAAGGDWYPEDAIVFGVVEGDDAVALPKNIMQVHELVNLTLGGRRLGIPYCTLCGSAQAYYTDGVGPTEEPLVLRTSGLLRRSNKVMFDLGTRSIFDTFTGEAVSGPLLDAGVTLTQTTVVVSSWGEWQATHPDTLIISQDGGIGRSYGADPLRGRDDAGPIFPIGPVDPRLPVHAEVIGVTTDEGAAIAFPVDAVRAPLADDRPVAVAGVHLVADAGGFRAFAGDQELPTHEAFWFAWSQFHPGTAVWTPIGSN